MISDATHRNRVLLAIQAALLGELSPFVRAVTVEHEGPIVKFIAYFDGPASEEDVESMSIVETNLMALLGETYEVSHEVLRRDYPLQVPTGDTWVYARREEV